MHWFERKIRRYEHRRWTTDDNRRVQPFDWGLEHIGGDPADPNPGEFVRQYAKHAIENSAEWFATTPATDYHLDNENVLTFTSSIESAWPENNTVYARLLPAHEPPASSVQSRKRSLPCSFFPTGTPSGMARTASANGSLASASPP